MCFPLCRDIPLPTLICYLPNVLLWMIRFCGRSLQCPPGPAPGQPAFLTVIVGPLQWDMLTSVYQENYAWTFVKTCRSVSGGQPEYQLCFASRRRNGCALLRDPAACFCSAGLSLRPAFTTFNFRHLPGASLRCPKLLLQDYGHETVSGAVNTACCRTDDAALCGIQKSPGMSPATSLFVQFVCPRKALKHLSLVPYKLEVRSSLTNTRAEISCLSQSHRLLALLWAGWPRKAAVLISPFLKVSHPEQEAGPPTPWAGSWR